MASYFPFWPARPAMAAPERDLERGHDEPVDSVPLEALSIINSASKRRDDLSLEDRIIYELKNNEYDCSICSDVIIIGTKPEIWQCKECFHTLHFVCLRTWYERNRQGELWKCPICAAKSKGAPAATCWCGSHKVDSPGKLSEDIPNSCEKICRDLEGACCTEKEYQCMKICHPGRCDEPTCGQQCPRRQEDLPDATPILPPPVVMAHAADDAVPPGQVHLQRRTRQSRQPIGQSRQIYDERFASYAYRSILACIIVTVLMGFGYAKHAELWAQPYVLGPHKRWFLQLEKLGALAFTIVATFLLTVFGSMPLFILAQEHSGRLARRPLWCRTIAFITCVTVALLWLIGPIVFFLCGPAFAWENQMENTCDGFDTIFNFDRYPIFHSSTHHGSRANPKFGQSIASERFMVNNLNAASAPVTALYMSDETFAHLSPQNITSVSRHGIKVSYIQAVGNITKEIEPSYYRISGNTTSPSHQPFDMYIDITNHSYSFCTSTQTCTADPALDHLQQNSSLDDCLEIEIETRKNSSQKINSIFPGIGPLVNHTCISGDWTPTTRSCPHLKFPSLEIQIPYFYNFTSQCELEPFMQVYSMRNLTTNEVEQQSERVWTSDSGPDVLGRTVSWGIAQKRLEMCVRRERRTVDAVEMLEAEAEAEAETKVEVAASRLIDLAEEEGSSRERNRDRGIYIRDVRDQTNSNVEDARILVPMGVIATMRARWKAQQVPDRGFCSDGY